MITQQSQTDHSVQLQLNIYKIRLVVNYNFKNALYRQKSEALEFTTENSQVFQNLKSYTFFHLFVLHVHIIEAAV